MNREMVKAIASDLASRTKRHVEERLSPIELRVKRLEQIVDELLAKKDVAIPEKPRREYTNRSGAPEL